MSTDLLIGRADELSGLEAAYRDETVHTVLIGGDAGIGKSRLVHEFITRLDTGPLVLTGRCLEFGNDGLPYAPFLPITRTLLPGRQFNDRGHLFGDILTVLEETARDRPLLLVLEDLHWADASSRELLAFLVANLSHPGIFIVGTHRPPTGPLRQLVAELSRSPAVRQLVPAALTRHEVGRQLAALQGSEPDPAAVTRIFERSQGNPLFVEALSGSPEGTPAELRELLLARLPHLTAPADHVLNVASVMGTVVDHDPLVAVAGVPEAELHRALRALVDEHLLVVSETGYVFRHALIRQAVYDRLLPAERKRLHAALAQALRGDEERVAQLAAHTYASGDHAAALVAAWAAAAAADRALAQAERLNLLQRVLSLWDEVTDPEAILGVDRLTVLDHTVEASIATNSVRPGLRWSAEALSLAPHPRRYFQRARLKNMSNAGGSEDLRQALAMLPEQPPNLLRGRVLAELAVSHLFAGDLPGAEMYARGAMEIAEHLGDQNLAAQAHAHLGLAATDPATAGRHFAEARAVADPQTLITVATWESALRVGLGEYEAAIAVIRQAIGAAHQVYEYARQNPVLVVKWAQALIGLGRCDEALELIDETLGEPDLPALGHAALLIGRAEAALALGDTAAARAAAGTAEKLLGEQPSVRPYRIRLRTIQARLAPQRAAEIYAAAVADGIEAHPHEAWALVAAAKPRPVPPLPVIGPVDAAHRAEALGANRQPPRARVEGRRPSTFGLTPRELDVLRLVAEGRSNRQIAQQLFISANTAGVHVSRILTKLNAATRTEAARRFLDAGLAGR